MGESITSDDQTVWTIKLKPGWTFHNGEPVTAQSFEDAWNAGAYFSQVEQVVGGAPGPGGQRAGLA